MHVMKKAATLLLLCCLNLLSLYATDYVFNRIYTVGNIYTIDPAADLNIPNTWNNYISTQNGGKGHYNEKYIVSDATAFSIVPVVSTHINAGGSGGTDYYTYQITAQKTGNYTFYQNVYVSTANSGTSHTVTYNITVVDVTSISIPSSLIMYVGAEEQLSPTIADTRAETTIIWNSSNNTVATVSSEGLITGLNVGSTTITCTAHNGVSAQCEVTVNPMLVSSITLNKTEAELVKDEKVQLTATVLPDNATDNSLIWSSTNEAVAVVSENGQVTAVGAGTCQVKATANDGSGKMASCLVTVLGNVLYCENFGAVPGATVMLPIQLTNADAIQGFEFKLVLPSGVSVQTDAQEKLAATLTDRASTQGLEGSNQGSGVYQFVFTSTNRLQGNNGAIVNVPIVVDGNVAVGQYPIVVKDVELVKYGTSAQIHHSDRTAALTIKEKTLSDVTGDGRISVADAISIINYVLGRTPVSFITIAADVNGDGGISLADAVATVDIILGGNNAGARAFVRSILNLDPQ